jgi:hypothetical protein
VRHYSQLFCKVIVILKQYKYNDLTKQKIMKLKLILVSFLLSVFLLSCVNTPNYTPRTFKNIKLQKFIPQKMGLEKLNSIRAIEVTDSITYFAAEGGKIYGFFNRGDFLETPNNFFDTIHPNFRAAAHTKKNLFALSIANPAYLYKMTNDSKNGIYDPKLVYTEDDKSVFYDAINFFDNINGIAIGDATEDCLSIITTNDGGDSWQKIACENLPKLIKGEAVFAASNTNIVIIKNEVWIITGGKQSRVMHSSNMGSTWQIYNTPLLKGTESTGGYSIAFSDAKNGIICGGDYTNKKGKRANKAVTKDGGKTWQLVSNGQEPGYISCVQYVPNTFGTEVFAVSTEGIYYSNNSGQSWLKVKDDGYYTIKFIDKNNAWLAGNGKIAKMILK